MASTSCWLRTCTTYKSYGDEAIFSSQQTELPGMPCPSMSWPCTRSKPFHTSYRHLEASDPWKRRRKRDLQQSRKMSTKEHMPILCAPGCTNVKVRSYQLAFDHLKYMQRMGLGGSQMTKQRNRPSWTCLDEPMIPL